MHRGTNGPIDREHRLAIFPQCFTWGAEIAANSEQEFFDLYLRLRKTLLELRQKPVQEFDIAGLGGPPSGALRREGKALFVKRYLLHRKT